MSGKDLGDRNEIGKEKICTAKTIVRMRIPSNYHTILIAGPSLPGNKGK